MPGFQKSPEFEQAVDALIKMQETAGLQGGYAILDLDLKVIDWQKEEWSADELIGAGTCKARVSEMSDRWYTEAALLAGLTYTLVNDRHMAEFPYDVAPGKDQLSKFVEGQWRVEYHLFGGRFPYEDDDGSPSKPLQWLMETAEEVATELPETHPWHDACVGIAGKLQSTLDRHLSAETRPAPRRIDEPG